MGALAALLTLPVAPLAAVGTTIFELAIDRYIVPACTASDSLPPPATAASACMALLYLATLALGFTFEYLQIRVMQKVGQETMYDLRKEIFERLQRLPMSFYDRSPVGRLVTRVTTDVDALNDLFASGIAAMVNDAFLLVLFVFIMLRMNWRLALATLPSLPFIVHGHLDFPQPGARRQPPHSHGHRAHQRLPARAHQRHERRPALQS